MLSLGFCLQVLKRLEDLAVCDEDVEVPRLKGEICPAGFCHAHRWGGWVTPMRLVRSALSWLQMLPATSLGKSSMQTEVAWLSTILCQQKTDLSGRTADSSTELLPRDRDR